MILVIGFLSRGAEALCGNIVGRADKKNCFNLPVARNAYGRRLAELHDALIWNAIPTDVKDANNFSMALKRFIVNSF